MLLSYLQVLLRFQEVAKLLRSCLIKMLTGLFLISIFCAWRWRRAKIQSRRQLETIRARVTELEKQNQSLKEANLNYFKQLHAKDDILDAEILEWK